MYVAKCPLRISLVGGSTDLEKFIDKYGNGAVISYPCNLYTYITIHVNNRSEYIINYTKTESFTDFDRIKNDVVRVVFKHFETELKAKPMVTVAFKSDIYSSGSGLAASSSYMIALIKAVSMYVSKTMSDIDICKLAIELEREFNPLTGYQDVYGCGVSNFKRIEFFHGKPPQYTFYDSNMLESYDMWLLHTGISRESTKILKQVDIAKSYPLLDKVHEMDRYISRGDTPAMATAINEGWEIKKQTSPAIMTPEIQCIEAELRATLNMETDAMKLCGAGGGGYFLIFRNNTVHESGAFLALKDRHNMTRIKVDEDGVTGVEL